MEQALGKAPSSCLYHRQGQENEDIRRTSASDEWWLKVTIDSFSVIYVVAVFFFFISLKSFALSVNLPFQ